MVRHWKWLWYVLALIFVVWILLTSSQLSKCLYQQAEGYDGHTFPEYIARLYPLLLGSRLCFGDFVHENSEAIIALFTITLGLATLALWMATKNLVVSAESSARHQLRAYVSYRAEGFEYVDTDSLNLGKTVQCRITIVNFGQTPAKNLKITWKTWVAAEREFMLDKPFEEKTGDGQNKFFAPNAEIPITPRFSRRLEKDEFEKFTTGYIIYRVAIHITYDDAFERPHFYKFGRCLKCETVNGLAYTTEYDGENEDDDSD